MNQKISTQEIDEINNNLIIEINRKIEELENNINNELNSKMTKNDINSLLQDKINQIEISLNETQEGSNFFLKYI